MAQPSKSAYTQGHHESVTRAHAARTPENSAAFLLPYLRPHMRILDIGCGPGTITTGFAKYVPNGSVVGIDTSETVLDQGRAYAKDMPNVTFELGNIMDGLDHFEDGSFDVVYCHQVLIHLPNPVAALKVMRRLCKKSISGPVSTVSEPTGGQEEEGGMVACREGDFGTVVIHPPRMGTDLWTDFYIKMLRKNGMEPFAGRNLHIWGRQAGFDPEKIEKSASSTLMTKEPERVWWGTTIQERFKNSDMRASFLAAGATEDDLINLDGGFEDWKADPDGWMVLTQGEVICRC